MPYFLLHSLKEIFRESEVKDKIGWKIIYIFRNKSVLSLLKYVACLNMKSVLRVKILFIWPKFHHSGETICPVLNYFIAI